MRNWWRLMLWCLPMLVSMAAVAGVERMRLEQVIGDGTDVWLYLDARNADGRAVPASDLGQLEVFVDGRSVEIESLKDFTESGEGVAFIFLVDVSKSLPERTYAQIRQALTDWIDALRPEDVAAIISFGATVEQRTGFTGDRDQLRAAVAALAPRDDWTRFYGGLRAAMDLGASHATDPGVPRRKLIVTLSDGDDDLPPNETGSTLEEIEEVADRTGIPVHAIAYNARADGLGVLGKLARRSGGSLLTAGDREHIAGSYADLRIRINEALVALGRCPDCPRDGNRYPLQVRLAGGVGVPGDLSVRMYAARPPAETSAETPEEIPEEIPEETSPPPTVSEPAAESAAPPEAGEPQPLSISDWRIWAGLGAAIAMIAGVLAIRGARRASSSPQRDPDVQSAGGYRSTPPDDALQSTVRRADSDPRGLGSTGVGVSGPGPRLRLTVITGGADRGRVFEVAASQGGLMGRSEECDIVLPGDDEISRQHARLEVRDGRVLIVDLGSTHGTFLNGVPVARERVLEGGDILRLGRTELNVGL